MTDPARLASHTGLATSLALLGDAELAELVGSAAPLGAGIGGRAALVEVDGRRVFVKRVPLTDTELLAANARSTANVFGLPPRCHYGIGGPGFGAWRELAVHVMTTNWALAGHFAGFPLMHHWRVLPDTPQPLHDELADVARAVTHWGGAEQVRERIEALRTASASLTLFLEYFPHTLHDWLSTALRTGDPDAVCRRVAEWLAAVTGFLRERQLLHFDAHFANVVTDGHNLCLTDFGLAASPRFRLARDERAFLDRHRGYDLAYTRTHLVNWLVADLYGHGGEERRAFVRACADGARPDGIPKAAAVIIARDARLAAVMGDFQRRLMEESTATPYPYDALRRAYNSSTLSA